jgi:hypothetical protein
MCGIAICGRLSECLLNNCLCVLYLLLPKELVILKGTIVGGGIYRCWDRIVLVAEFEICYS